MAGFIFPVQRSISKLRCFIGIAPIVVCLMTIGLLSGCMKPVERHDPLSGLDVSLTATPVFPNISLGLIESANTKDTEKLLSKAAIYWCPTAFFGDEAFDHKQIIKDFKDDMGHAFKSMTSLNTIVDAQAAKVDWGS